jgi:hypothetical protein
MSGDKIKNFKNHLLNFFLVIVQPFLLKVETNNLINEIRIIYKKRGKKTKFWD